MRGSTHQENVGLGSYYKNEKSLGIQWKRLMQCFYVDRKSQLSIQSCGGIYSSTQLAADCQVDSKLFL